MRRRLLQWALALGAVALVTVLVFSYFLQRTVSPSRPIVSIEKPLPTATTRVPPTLAPLPSNWTRLLPDYRLSDNGNSSGMVASAARPGRVAACALPGATQSGTPVFALSNDIGRTWQTYIVPVLSRVSSCAVLADSRRPDTFITGHTAFGPDYDGTPAAITADGGRTWRALSWPPQAQIALGGSALVDGRLVVSMHTQQDGRQRLAETTLDGGAVSWRTLDDHIPYSANDLCKCVTAFAVDYANPARIYVAIYADQLDLKSGITVYVTSNSGASWSAVRNWAGSQRLALWTTLNGNVYVWDERYSGAEEKPLYLSTNHGASWTDLKLPVSVSARVFVGVSGRKVVATVNTDIYLYDTTLGAFAQVGQLPNLWYLPGVNELLGVVVEGSAPVFIAASQAETAFMTLSSL